MRSYCVAVFASVLLTASTLNITISQTSLSIAFGQTGRLNCSAVGGEDTLPLTLSWTTSANVSISTVVTTQQSVATVANTLTLPSVNTSYRGVYTCTVNDAAGTVQSSSIGVNVTVPPPNPNTTISSGLIAVGMNVTLTCNPGDGMGGATIRVYQWSKGGVVLQDGGRVSGSTQAILRITSAIFEDQGSYRCTVTNVDGVSVASGSAQLNVTASTLNITISQTSLSIAFGQSGRLNCSAMGGGDTLPLTLSWTTSANVSISTVVTTQLFVPMIANTLLLPTVNTSYRGVYKCTVNDAIRTVQSSVLVNVTVPPSSPTMTISPLGLVSIGTNATLTCNPGDGVGGATIRVYQWSKGDVVLQDGGRVSGSTQATLRITSAILEDQGSYRCTVTNVDGVSVASGSAQLNVTGPLFTTQLNSSTSLVVSSSLTLVCVADNSPGSPNLAASWSYPQRPGDPRVLTSVALFGNSTVTTWLSVTNVSSNDSGVYSCKFSNGILKGGINSSTLVSVLYPPQIVSFKSLTSTTVITAPSNIALQCEVSPLASLPISFVITRTSNGITEQVFAVNNASVRVNYTSGPSKASSTGTYRCSASNSVRSDSRELQITVKDKPQSVAVSTISHQFLSLSTILITWRYPPDNNDIITNYSMAVCPSSSSSTPCSTSVVVDVRSLSALVTSYTPNQTYMTSISAFNSVGGSTASVYFFRSPGIDLAAPTNVEVLLSFSGGVLVSWRLPNLGDPSLLSTVTVANFTLCYTKLLASTCTDVSFHYVFYRERQALGCVLSGVLPGVTYNITVTTRYLVPAVVSAPTSVQIALPLPIGLRSPVYYIFQNITGQFVALLSWDGFLSPRALAFVDSFVVSYALFSRNGSSFEDFANFTTNTTSAFFSIKLNAKYLVMVFARLNTLSGLQFASLFDQGLTIVTPAEGGPNDASLQASKDRDIITGVASGVAAVVAILLAVICVLFLKLCLRPKPAASSILSSIPDRLSISHQLSSITIPLTDCAAYTSTLREKTMSVMYETPVSCSTALHAKTTPLMYEIPVSCSSSEPNNRDSQYQQVYDRVAF